MSDPSGSSKHVLDPIDRVSEVLFGLIMVLTFTGSLSVVDAGRSDVRTMLIGALGCNLAWGVIDGIFYLMGCLAERGRSLQVFRAVHQADNAQVAQRIIAGALPPIVASLLQPHELDSIRERLVRLPAPPARAHLSKNDYLGALGVSLLVFLSTVPVALPFTFTSDVALALRVSNGVAIVLLFWMGYTFGRMTGRRPVWVGLAMVVFGAMLVGATIALGG